VRPCLGIFLVVVCCLAFVHEGRPATPAELKEQEILRLCDQGDYPEAIALATAALQSIEHEFGPADTAVARSLTTLARIYDRQGQYESAEPLYERALAILEAALGQDHLDVAAALSNLALVYQAQGSDASAEWLFARGLAITEKAAGFDSPNVVEFLNSLASLCFAQARYEEAERLCARALGILEKRADANQFALMALRRNMTSIHEMMARDSLATPDRERTGTTPGDD
jgi:tetratricopeptide (TPR) repeat protein